MSNQVVFEDETANTISNISIVRGVPTGMLAWLVKKKIAKDGRQAEKLLLGVAVVAIILAIAIYFLFNTTHSLPHVTYPPFITGSEVQAH